MITANGNCVACNEKGGRQYALRLHDREGNHKEVNPTLCDSCADEHLTLDWIERRVTLKD